MSFGRRSAHSGILPSCDLGMQSATNRLAEAGRSRRTLVAVYARDRASADNSRLRVHPTRTGESWKFRPPNAEAILEPGREQTGNPPLRWPPDLLPALFNGGYCAGRSRVCGQCPSPPCRAHAALLRRRSTRPSTSCASFDLFPPCPDSVASRIRRGPESG